MDRLGFIGSSDAAAVLGLSRWKTPLQIWAEKTGQVVPEDISDEEAVRLGIELEDYVARRFMRVTGKKVMRPPNQQTEHQVHPKYPFLTCVIDRRVVGEDALLECKTAGAWKAKEWKLDEVPQEYIIQVMHQLAVTGKQKGYIAALIGNQEFKWQEIKRDEILIADMVKREVSFWNDFIVPKIMPAFISCKDSGTIYELFDSPVPESVVVLGEEANQLCDDIQAMKKDLESLEGSIEQKRNVLKIMLKENEAGVSSRYKITWKEQKANRLDSKALKDNAPEIYRQYAKESKTRVLKIAELKAEGQ
jgi:putative phage-type endonuclease